MIVAFSEVLAAAQAGDETSFAELWRGTQPALLRYLRVVAPGAAEDLAAEAWTQALGGLSTFSGDEAAFRGWLFTIARRKAIDLGRTTSRRRTYAVAAVPEDPASHAVDTADLALERLSTQQALALVATLPPDQAEIVALRVIAGLDTETVARLVGKSPGAVRVAAHRGLRRLAQLLDRAGVTP